MLQKILKNDQSKTTILIRLMVGTVFLSEGIQKFLFPALRGAGRFKKIGLYNPDFLDCFVGTIEILCGILILIGFLTRVSSTLTLVIMLVAIATTKSELIETSGFWTMMHASRTDWAMLLGSVFLIFKGSGLWSLDNKIYKIE